MTVARVARLAPLFVLVGLVAVGCQPTVTGTAAPSNAAPSIATPSSPAPTSAATSSWLESAEEINAVVSSMAAAVLAGDRAGYLALIDLSDPTFALEHTRWADGWAGRNPASEYTLKVSGLVIDGEEATGQMAVTWVVPGTGEYEFARTASYQVRFTGGPGAWRYAGEHWVVTDVEHFRIKVAPGLEDLEPGVAAELPAVYEGVTKALGYVATAPLEIKLYADGPSLVANTLLSLPEIRGWNEPGEALKLVANRSAPSVAQVVAHEFTHFSMFDRAGTQRTRMPWWLDEGIATYVAEPFERNDPRDRLGQVIAWAAAGELASWESMEVFETAPVDLWTFVYPQGYAMVRYVTETYGESKRNAWLAAMATEMDIDGATPAVLGRTFDELDADFRKWLAAGP